VAEDSSLWDRFPAIRRLGQLDRMKRVVPIQQLSVTECGATCLAMVLAYYGRPIPLEQIREALGVSRDGTSALAVVTGARHFGLQARGVKLELQELEYLPTASILHWEFNHFVVFERFKEGGADIVDPMLGRRHVGAVELGRAFTGIAIVLEPGSVFEVGAKIEKPIWRYLRQTLRSSDAWLRSSALSIAIQVFALAVPIMTSAIVDRIVPRGDYQLLTVLCAGLVSLLGFNLLAALVRGHLLVQLRTQLDLRMTLGFLEHLVSLPYAFFQRRLAGDLLMRLSSHATIREILTSGVLSGVIDGVLVTSYLGVIFFVSPGMGLLVLTLGALQVLVFALSRKRQHELMSENLQIQARTEAYQVELIAGIETLKASGSEARAVESWTDLFVDTLNVALKRGRLAALVDAIAGTFRLGSPLIILAWGASHVLDGQLTLGTMLGLSALAAGFLGPLASLVATAGQLQNLVSYVDRIDDVLQAEPEQDRAHVRKVRRLSGRIELERVSFRYSALAPLVVEDVSLRIEPGQFVALVGPSGSGKSTLASLLLALYRPSSGRIAYDGANLLELESRSVRSQMGIVVQRPYLFGTTLGANIALTDPSTPIEDIVRAAKLAHVHDEIAAMPMGYDTPVIGGGSSLSGGQRQRIALARALVHQPAIVLLDEATSALDSVTECKVQESLARLECTRIVIAHRLSTVMAADVILVMVGGRIVERGTHAELVAGGGVYRQLVEAQLSQNDPAPPRAARTGTGEPS
jgi:ATP-binding cassette, subfamily B, bacterial